MFNHTSVLLHEAVAALDPQPSGVYLDGTAGGGGHSAWLLEHLRPGGGHLFCLDRDPDAQAALRARFAGEPQVTVLQGNFFSEAALPPGQRFAGILLDLGVSSHQLDTPERGFSYHHNAKLDMRMSQSGPTAAELLATLSEPALRQLLQSYAGEKHAGAIARAIVAAQQNGGVHTTLQLAELVAQAVPASYRRAGHPARKTFMALRYACNGELDGLEPALLRLFERLEPGGRMAVIGFNSLEDAAIKHVTRQLLAGCTCPPAFPVCICGKTARARVPQKPITPTGEELQRNPRARSAKLRVLQRI